MSKVVKGLLITGIVGAILLGGAKALNKFKSFSDKLKLFTAIPQVHSYKGGNIILKLAGLKIFNQSDVALQLQNLYVNIKYLNPDSKVYEDLAIQTNNVAVVNLKKNSMNTVATIELSLPVSNIGVISGLISGKINHMIKVITRFQLAGAEVELETMIDGKAMAAPVRALLKKFGLAGTQQSTIEVG